MLELEQILREHAAKYPLMQPQDAVKLIYQNEFGSGHMIRDAVSCMQRLEQEYQETIHDTSLPACEPIGNRIFRIHLAAIQPEDVSALGEAFIRTAAEYNGTLPYFLDKLQILIQLTKAGIFHFTPEELDIYLREYANAGYPMVSHSEIYRQRYIPAYRIIRK